MVLCNNQECVLCLASSSLDALQVIGVESHRKAQTDVVILEVAMVNQQGSWLEQHQQQPPLLF